MNISSIHVTDFTSSPESLCLIVRRSMAAGAVTSWIMMVGRESEIVIVMANPVLCWLIVRIMVDSVSCWHLIVDSGGAPWSRWQLMVDPDCVLWWHPIVMADPGRGGCWPWTMITTRHYNNYTWHLLHFCPSWERDPSHVVLSEVSTFFLPC